MSDNSLIPSEAALMTAMMQIFGIDPQYLQTFLDNFDDLELMMNTMRPKLAVMAELGAFNLLAQQDPTMIRFMLPRLMPHIYSLNAKQGPTNPGEVVIRFEGE